jgi:hypothetical protein
VYGRVDGVLVQRDSRTSGASSTPGGDLEIGTFDDAAWGKSVPISLLTPNGRAIGLAAFAQG